MDKCRVTTYHNNRNNMQVAGRRIVPRHVHGITSLENGQLFSGMIRFSGKTVRVWRHQNDEVWTSYREEATGASYQRIKQEVAQ